MKNLLLTGLMLFTISSFAQKNESSDTTEIALGTKKIIIVDNEEYDSTKANKEKFFNAWEGIELGFNALRTSDGSFTMPEELNFMELDYARSLTWNFNIVDQNWDWTHAEEKHGYKKTSLGMISGLGLTFENYSLENNYTLVNQSDSTFGVFDSTRSYTKNKLRTSFLRMPLMIQFYTMKKVGKEIKHRFHFAAGVVGGLRLGGSYKVKYKVDGDEEKEKFKDDYNLSPFSLDAEVRMGYGSLNLFASYGLTPLFEDGRGPELYPLTVGLSLSKVF